MQGLHVGTDLDHWFGRGRRRRSGGFTLIELILVIAVIAIMAALAMPFIASASRSFRMSRGAREVHAALLQARAAAITSRQNICVQPVTHTARAPALVSRGWDQTPIRWGSFDRETT